MSDPPPPGRAATDEAMKAVGEGIQAFGLVEWQMACIYAALMAPADFRLCSLTLEGAQHFETKRRILVLVGKEKLSGERLATFNNLMNRAGKKADFRHKLAHWHVADWVDMKKAKKGGKAAPKPALQPPIHSSRFAPVHMGDERPIFPDEMKRFAEGCRKLFVEMQGFAGLLRS